MARLRKAAPYAATHKPDLGNAGVGSMYPSLHYKKEGI